MIIIYFLYGLAFIIFGILLFYAPKENVFVDIFKDIRLVGLFGIFHGVSEWIILLIYLGRPFDPRILNIIGSFILPLSFAFIMAYGVCLVSRFKPAFKGRLKLVWMAGILLWGICYLSSGDIVLTGIIARYFMCLPAMLLCGLGIYLASLQSGPERLPRIVSLSIKAAICVILFYGVFCGIIVPQKNFLLASFINEVNFFKIFGVPVQLFRMLCPVLLLVCYFGVTKVYSQEGPKTRFIGGIQRKTSIMVALYALIAGIIGIVFMYVFSFNMLYHIIGEDYQQTTKLLAASVAHSLENEVAEAQTYVTRPFWLDASKEKNSSYQDLIPLEIAIRLKRMNPEWIASSLGSPLVKPYVDNIVADSMRSIMQIKETLSELFITDQFGGVVAASGKTSDFYQADQEWWQAAYNKGEGAVFVGDIEYNRSSQSWVQPFAVPMYDKDHKVVGICKDSISMEKFLAHIVGNFKIRRTGKIILVNHSGQVLYHPNLPFLSVGFSDQSEFKKLIQGDAGYRTIKDFGNQKKLFVAFSRVILPGSAGRDKSWFVFIEQEEGETFESLRVFLGLAVGSLFFILFIIGPLGYFLSGRAIAKPISVLMKASQEASKGNWDYQFNIKTGDEIEEFADVFRQMMLNIKYKQKDLLAANKNIEDFARDLEKKVASRTKELSEANEASLNILEDLTAAKKKLDEYTKELENALQVKSDFTSMVSHELRTPLTAIKEGVAIVYDGSAGEVNEEQKDFLGLVKRNVDRLARLINEVLDFQKLEAGHMVFHMDECYDINFIVADVQRTMLTLAQQKGLELIFNAGEDLPLIRFDKDKITQVLTNLVNNAIKFTDKGRITISTTHGENFVQVQIKDTGIGVKEEDMPKLFQQFSQIQDGNERKTGGSGLGLAISKQIVEKHRGKIWAESAYGQGSSFFFILPIHERRVANEKKDPVC